MRILFITATYLPTINGVSYQIEILRKALADLGHRVFILAPSFPGYSDKTKNVFRYPSLPNPISKKYPVGLPLISPKSLRKINPDIIHVHHPSFVGQAASILAHALNVPLIFTANTHYRKYLHLYFPHGKKITSQVLGASLKNLAEKCFRTVCPSTQIQKELERNGVRNTILISNSIEKDFFKKPPKKILKNPILVFTGRLEKEKNPLFLIQIAKGLKQIQPDFQLIIAGGGSFFDKLEIEIYKERLQENITLVGDVSRESLREIYKQSHIFVTPSVTEVMPLSVIEAMAAGLPILALKRSGLEDIVVDGKNGFLLPKDPKVIARKISNLFAKPKTLYKLAAASYKHALNFSVEVKSKELVKLYKEAISDKRGTNTSRGRRGKTS